MSASQTLSAGLIGLGLAVALISGNGSTAQAQDWKADWEATIAAAKKEGELVMFTRRYDEIVSAFNKSFPGIKVVTVTGRGSELGTRIIAEQRAGKYLADLYIGGPYTVDSMLLPAKSLDAIAETLILPEVMDGPHWLTGKVRYSDLERKYNIAFLANSGGGQIAYNTKLVKAEDFKSWRDLMDPKWNGKIVTLDPTQTFIGGTTQVMYFSPTLGPDFFKSFYSKRDLTYASNNRQMTDWLAAGKYAVCIGCLHVEKAIQQGLPLGIFDTAIWREGASYLAGSGTISLIKNAPHPNAAKLFINWFLSREGQILLQDMDDLGTHHNSSRVDIPKEIVSEENRLIEGATYQDQNSPAWADVRPMIALGKDIIAERAKK